MGNLQANRKKKFSSIYGVSILLELIICLSCISFAIAMYHMNKSVSSKGSSCCCNLGDTVIFFMPWFLCFCEFVFFIDTLTPIYLETGKSITLAKNIFQPILLIMISGYYGAVGRDDTTEKQTLQSYLESLTTKDGETGT